MTTPFSLSSTNRVAHAKVRENTFGVTPTTPAFKAMRVTSSSLAANPVTVVSDEIRADRQITDLILVGQQAQGDVGCELSYGTEDDDFEEALQSTWATKPAIIVVTAATEISALSSTTATLATGGAAFKAGMICQLTNFPTPSNNKTAVLSSETATTLVFPASSFTAETAPIPVGATIRAVGFQGASGDIAATTTGLGSTVLDFTTLPLVVGEWIKLGGALSATQFATAADNDWVRISAIAAHALTFDRLPTSWAADAGTGKTISVWMGDYVRNGTTMYSNTIERQYQDQATPTYEYLRGMTLDKLNLTLTAQKIATMTRSYMGATGSFGTSRFTGASDVAATTTAVLNAAANVGRIALNGSLVTGPNYIMEATIALNNNLRMLNAVGNLGAVGIGEGEFDLTGTLNTYFGDSTIVQQVISNAQNAIDFRVGRSDGSKQTILFDMPTVKFSSGAPAVPGKNQNVMLSVNYQALRDATYGYTLHVARYPYTE